MTKKLNGVFEWLFFILLIALSLILALGSGFSGAVLDGVRLWAACVLPSLFPYFFITTILSSLSVTGKFSNFLSPFTKRVFKCGGVVGYAFFMSLISGYPVGAKTVSDLKNNGLISDGEAVRAACACSTSSPMFLISSVGVIMFNSTSFGLKLLITHLISAVINGFIFSFYAKKEKLSANTNFTPKKADNLLYESVYSSVISVLIVGGLITVFYLFTEILLKTGVLNPFISLLNVILKNEQASKAVILSIFECTKGLKCFASANLGIYTLPLCASVCGFGGLSVIFQSVAYLKNAKIKTAPFLLSKVVAAVLSFVIGLIIILIFP